MSDPNKKFVTTNVYYVDIVDSDEGLPKKFIPIRNQSRNRRLRVREETWYSSLSYMLRLERAPSPSKPTFRELEYEIIGTPNGITIDGDELVFDGTAGLRCRTRREPLSLDEILVSRNVLLPILMAREAFPDFTQIELTLAADESFPTFNPWRRLDELREQLKIDSPPSVPDQVVRRIRLDDDVPGLQFDSTIKFPKHLINACPLVSASSLQDIKIEFAGGSTYRLIPPTVAWVLPLFWYPFNSEAFAAGLIVTQDNFRSFGRLGAQSSGYHVFDEPTIWRSNEEAHMDFLLTRKDEGGSKSEFMISSRCDLETNETYNGSIELDSDQTIEAYINDVPYFIGAMPLDDPKDIKVGDLRSTDGNGFAFFEGRILCSMENPTIFDPIINCQHC